MRDNRKYERFSMSLAVHVKDKQGLHQMKTGNISKYGLFLGTSDPKPPRQLVQLVIELPEIGETIEALAQVMWIDATGTSERSEGIPGMGVKFFSMEDKSRRRWEDFVELVRFGRISRPVEPKAEEPEGADVPSVHRIGEEELADLGDIDLGSEEAKDLIDEAVEEISEEEMGDLEDALTSFEESRPLKEAGAEPSLPGAASPLAGLTPADADIERRDYPRKVATFLVRSNDLGQMRELYTRDISLGGMFIKTPLPRQIGDKIRVVLVHPWTEEEFPMMADVRRIEKSASGKTAGLGVEFQGIGEPLRDSLLTYIETGFLIVKEREDEPIESAVIRRIELVEKNILRNPIDGELHREVGLLYLALSNWEKAHEHLDIAEKLGIAVPGEVLQSVGEKLQHGKPS